MSIIQLIEAKAKESNIKFETFNDNIVLHINKGSLIFVDNINSITSIKISFEKNKVLLWKNQIIEDVYSLIDAH